jgi:hypothetical protein
MSYEIEKLKEHPHDIRMGRGFYKPYVGVSCAECGLRLCLPLWLSKELSSAELRKEFIRGVNADRRFLDKYLQMRESKKGGRSSKIPTRFERMLA